MNRSLEQLKEWNEKLAAKIAATKRILDPCDTAPDSIDEFYRATLALDESLHMQTTENIYNMENCWAGIPPEERF
jgi:hypothetical protein